MKFKCITCDRRKPLVTFGNPEGRVVLKRWYRDETGLDHYIAACLDCGTIHDCVTSFKAFIGMPWRTVGALQAADVIAKHKASAEALTFEVFATFEFAIPAEILRELVAAGHFPTES